MESPPLPANLPKTLVVDIRLATGGQTNQRGRTIRFSLGEESPLLVVKGESGSGKTSLLRVLAGLDLPLSGTIRLGETVWDDPTAHRPGRLRPIAYLPQRDCLYPHLSLKNNVSLALSGRGLSSIKTSQLVSEVLETMGLSGVLDVPVDSLSGGQRKRAVLARLLLLPAEVVLLDEPLNGLDPKAREWCVPFLKKTFRERGSLVLWVTHDPREETLLSGEVLDFDEGEEPESGSAVSLSRPSPGKGDFWRRLFRWRSGRKSLRRG